MSGSSLLSGDCLVAGQAEGELLFSRTPLSFWGGVDSATGKIVDAHHPLCGQYLRGRILAMPSGRGSCSASGVLLELLMNGLAPSALIFSRPEPLLTLGVFLAEAIAGFSIPVVMLDTADFLSLENLARVSVSNGLVGAVTHQPDQIAAAADDAALPAITLSDRDRALLAGDEGKAAQLAMQIILRMARLQGASSLIDIEQVHIDGCIYTGPASLTVARRMLELGARTVVPTSLNAISVDEQRWRQQGVAPATALPAAELARLYVDMGARPTFTCAPYQLSTAPKLGQHIAWAESNAVVYANSVIGARTAKYPDYLDLCIALTGRAPLADCHLPENRRAGVRVNLIDIAEADDSLYPLLGYHVGQLVDEAIPVVCGLAALSPGTDDLRAFAAAFATTSSAPMFHIAGVTPEAPTVEAALGGMHPLASIDVSCADLRESWRELNGSTSETIDLVSLGNPHFSIDEFSRTAELLAERRLADNVDLIITASRATLALAAKNGAKARLEAAGARCVTDTCWCMITEPVVPPTARTIMTNSAKYAHYGPGLVGREFRFASLADCVEAACSGTAAAPPSWLSASAQDRG